MLALAAVPDQLLPRLQFAANGRFRFVAARSWDETLAAILTKPLELGVLDPALDGRARSQEIERLRVLFPSFPLILYTNFTPAVAPVLLRLGQVGVRQVGIARHDEKIDDREFAHRCTHRWHRNVYDKSGHEQRDKNVTAITLGPLSKLRDMKRSARAFRPWGFDWDHQKSHVPDRDASQ